MLNTKNIYYRFLDDSFREISLLEKEINKDSIILDKIYSGKIVIFRDKQRVIEDRYRTNSKEVNRMYSDIFSLKIACIRDSKVDPCREAKKFLFESNQHYIEYLLSMMIKKGYTYNDNIILDIRNMYMMMSRIEDKDFNINVGKKIRVISFFK